ncbi:MAG: hypothetical protein ABEI98_06015 [Halorhabdus sp.]
MVPTQDAVVVASPREDVQSSITSVLRDHWPVRTATTVDRAIDSLDDAVSVLVIDQAFGDGLSACFDRLDDDRFLQVLVLKRVDAPAVERADAISDSDRLDGHVRETVARLNRRARYDRLLTRFYELARTRAGDERSDRSAPTETELATLKRELDDLVARLDDHDAFEMALTRGRPDDRGSSEKTY